MSNLSLVCLHTQAIDEFISNVDDSGFTDEIRGLVMSWLRENKSNTGMKPNLAAALDVYNALIYVDMCKKNKGLNVLMDEFNFYISNSKWS